MGIEDFHLYRSFSEGYEVVRTVEIVAEDTRHASGSSRRYRIEALRVYRDANVPFIARVYVEEVVMLPSESRGETHHAWLRVVDFPWVHESTADATIERALWCLGNEIKDSKAP